MDAPKVTVRNFAYKLGLPKWDKIPTTALCLNGNSNLEHILQSMMYAKVS